MFPTFCFCHMFSGPPGKSASTKPPCCPWDSSPQNSPPQNTFVDTVEGSPVDFSYRRVCSCDHYMNECVHMSPVDEYTVVECVSKTPVKGYVPMTLHREAHPQDPIMKKSTINSEMEAVLL